MNSADRAREAWEAYIGSGRDVETAKQFFTADCVFEDPPEVPDARSWSGPDALRDYERNFGSTWDDYELELREVIDCRDMAIAVVGVKGFARDTQVALDAELAFLGHYRHGKAYRVRCFLSCEAALAAAAQEGARAS